MTANRCDPNHFCDVLIACFDFENGRFMTCTNPSRIFFLTMKFEHLESIIALSPLPNRRSRRRPLNRLLLLPSHSDIGHGQIRLRFRRWPKRLSPATDTLWFLKTIAYRAGGNTLEPLCSVYFQRVNWVCLCIIGPGRRARDYQVRIGFRNGD